MSHPFTFLVATLAPLFLVTSVAPLFLRDFQVIYGLFQHAPLRLVLRGDIWWGFGWHNSNRKVETSIEGADGGRRLATRAPSVAGVLRDFSQRY